MLHPSQASPSIEASDPDPTGQQGDFVVYHSQAKVASFAALFLVMLPAMPWMFFTKTLPRHDGRVVWTAVFMLCLFLCFGFAFWTAFRFLLTLRSAHPKPALVINDRGFLDQTKISGGMGWVPWEDVARFYLEPSGRFLCIRLRNEEAYWKRQPRWEGLNRWLRRLDAEGPTINVAPMLLSLSLPELLAQMQQAQARHLQNQQASIPGNTPMAVS